MELDSRKKIRRDKIMSSKSFDTQEVREIGWKEAGEARGFPILWMGIIEDVFQMEGKECKYRKDRKCEEENPCQSEGGALAWNRQLCLGQYQWTWRGWRQPHEIQQGRRRSKRTNETPQGTWLGVSRKGSLWLCYPGPLAGR